MDNIQITLLTYEEYKTYKDIVPLVNNYWWLHTPFNSALVRIVDPDGNISPCGQAINYYSGVRPVLRMKLSNSKSLCPGDTIRIGSKNFTVLSWNENELVALCDEIIAVRKFDSKNGNWETSELKVWLETEGLKLIF